MGEGDGATVGEVEWWLADEWDGSQAGKAVGEIFSVPPVKCDIESELQLGDKLAKYNRKYLGLIDDVSSKEIYMLDVLSHETVSLHDDAYEMKMKNQMSTSVHDDEKYMKP